MAHRQKVLVYGALAAIAAVMISANALADDETGRTASYAFIVAVGLFLVASVLFQLHSARRTLGDQRDGDGGLDEARALDDAGRITDVPEMFQLLALREFDPTGLRRLRRLMLGNTRIWIGFMLPLSVVPLGVIGLAAADGYPDISPIWAWAGLAVIVVGSSALLLWMHGRTQGVAEDVLEPLGLAEVATDEEYGWGYGGERHGRQVMIEVGPEEWKTQIAAAVEPFELRESRGRLRVKGDAPAQVGALVERLRSAPAWRGIREVRGGPDSIVTTREPGSGFGHGWLWDLWLAERLALELRESEAAAA